MIDPVTNSIRKLLSSYARIFNTRYQRSGSVFRQKTKAKCLSEIRIDGEYETGVQEYYTNCFHYIHQNPLKANLVTTLEDWEFSSFKDYAGLRDGTLCDRKLATTYCNYAQNDFREKSLQEVEEKYTSRFI